ncbi:pre-neck appendage protein [Clostridium phage vB_CpeP_15N3]|nr:pre-neck appendage protein [Clostridium phage XP15-N3]
MADVKGRGFNVILNDFEFNGEPSDPQRPKPTSVDDMIFGCKLLVSGNGGFSSGAIKFEGNYTEETLGMLYIKNTGGTCQGVDINCNMAYPYNTTEMENIGIYLDGWLDRINISNNNMYFAKKLVLNGNQIQG